MQFWNIRLLAQRLATRHVTAQEKMLYLLFYIGIWALMSSVLPAYWMEPKNPPTPQDAFIDGIGILFEIVLLLESFRVNQRGDGAEFIDRYICLSLPLFVRGVVVTLTAVAFLSMLPLPQELAQLVIIVAVYAYMYRVMMGAMRLACGLEKGY